MHVEIYPRKYFVADSSKSTRPHESGLVAFSTAKTSVCIAGGLYSLRFHKFTILLLVFAGYVFRVDEKRIRNKMIADKNEFCSG